MRTKKLLSILVIGIVFLGACVRPPVAPAPSPAPATPPGPPETPSTPISIPVPATTPIPSSAPKETPSTPTSTGAPTTTPTPPSTPTGPYTGPLFDTHLHIAHLYAGDLSRLRSAADLLSYLDRNKVEGAIGFYYLLKDKLGSSTAAKAEVIIRGTRSRVIPLLQPEGDGWTQFASGQYSEAVLRQYLQPQGLLQGVGEIPLYHAPLQSVTFDSPLLQTVFQVVNDLKGIVMIQPSDARRGRPTELAEIEPSIRKYPDAIFLFHGLLVFNLVVPLMAKYPNVYYTMDATNWIFYSRYNLMEPTDAAADNAESFMADVNRIGVLDSLLEGSFARVAPLIQQYPDRIMWGTDISAYWHFEEPVTDVVISLSRQLIGRLPPDVQEKYAYRNALRVFGRFLPPNK